jgi:pyruvate formate lyase activating enzyme
MNEGRRRFLLHAAGAAFGLAAVPDLLHAEDARPLGPTPPGAPPRSPAEGAAPRAQPGSDAGEVAPRLPSPDSRFVKEAFFYEKLDGHRIRCGTCPHGCVLSPGETGICRAKANLDGRHFSLSWGNPCSVNVDPIEKKPLLHFLPESKAFSLAVAGCNFRCFNCQNWEISQVSALQTRNYDLDPGQVVEQARTYGCRSIAFTYSEPTSFYEYAVTIAEEARAARLRTVWVSNGYIAKAPRDRLCRYLAAAAVNLKSFEDRIYRDLNGGELQPVLDTLVAMKRAGVWLEVINLVIPTWTDNLEMVKRMCGWFVGALGPDTPLHFSRFSPLYKLTHLPPTPVETLLAAREIARAEGLHFAYVGNVPEVGEDTACPACGKTVLARRGFRVLERNLKDGRCGKCGAGVAGVWT